MRLPAGPASAHVSNLQQLTTFDLRTHGNATIGVKVVPASGGSGNGGRDLLSLGKSDPTIRLVDGTSHENILN